MHNRGLKVFAATFMAAVIWAPESCTAIAQSEEVAPSEQTPQALVTESKALTQAGDYKLAVSACNKAILLDKSCKEAYLAKAAAEIRLGQSDNAIQDFTKAIELAPNDREGYFQRGLVLYEQHKLAESIADFDKAILIDPTDNLSFGARATSYSELGDHSKAILDYERALEIDEFESDGPSLAREYTELKKQQAGLDYFTELLGRKPSSMAGLLGRAQLLQNTGQYQKAYSDCTNAIVIKPASASTYFLRAQCLESLKQWEKAIVDYSKAISLEPQNFKYLLYRGKAFELHGLFDKAEADYARMQKTTNRYWRVKGLTNSGKIQLNRNQPLLAIERFSQALKLDPKNIEALLCRGHCYCDTGQHEKGLKDYYALGMDQSAMSIGSMGSLYYTYAIKRYPTSAWAYAGRGKAHTQTSDYKEAVEDCTLAVSLDPKCANGYMYRGLAYKKLGQQQKAVEDFSRAVKLDPNLAAQIALQKN